MSTVHNTNTSNANLPELPSGMEWRVSPAGAKVRLRVRGRHIGTFDTVAEALGAQAAALRGEPWPPAPTAAAPTRPVMPAPDLSRLARPLECPAHVAGGLQGIRA